MKRSATIAFVTLALLPVLDSRAPWALPAQAGATPRAAKPKNTPIISRENFVSLSWEQSGGFAGLTTSLEVEGNMFSYSSGRLSAPLGNVAGTPAIPTTKAMSGHQLDGLIFKLNRSRIPALVGNYRQPNLADGFQEVLVLTISDKNDQDQRYIIQNYGDRAPKGYVQFTTFFRALAGKKFPNSPLEPPPKELSSQAK